MTIRRRQGESKATAVLWTGLVAFGDLTKKRWDETTTSELQNFYFRPSPYAMLYQHFNFELEITSETATNRDSTRYTKPSSGGC